MMFKGKGSPTTDTLIGYGTKVEGKITCTTNLRVEGHVEGDIECTNDVSIGESSECHSNITAKNITIAGKVLGDLNIAEQLTIMPSGQLTGNFTCKSIVIHEGGIFNGTSTMIQQTKNKQDHVAPTNKGEKGKATS